MHYTTLLVSFFFLKVTAAYVSLGWHIVRGIVIENKTHRKQSKLFNGICLARWILCIFYFYGFFVFSKFPAHELLLVMALIRTGGRKEREREKQEPSTS